MNFASFNDIKISEDHNFLKVTFPNVTFNEVAVFL